MESESEEIDIFVLMEDGTKYTLDIRKAICYSDLFEILKEKIIGNSHFDVIFKGIKYTEDDGDKILNFLINVIKYI